ncbi:hypothetical protein [Haliea sp. E17]|uniref:hypothetical protein n=1 Tax=Haliea sp. E17 TaxID=3401576 RepID=UPI003AAE3E19
MSESKPSETETILMALDQISQTIDVMTSVVGRLRHYVQQQGASADSALENGMPLPSERIVH